MTKHYKMGTVDADPSYDSNIIDLSTFTNVSNVGSRRNGSRAGTLDRPQRMEEADEPGGIADMNDEKVRNAAIEDFANKIKKAVSAKLMGKKINLNLKGHKDIVAQIANMIKLETQYLNELINGQDAKTPALQKTKAIIDAEAKKLDRMFGSSDVWPFK